MYLVLFRFPVWEAECSGLFQMWPVSVGNVTPVFLFISPTQLDSRQESVSMQGSEDYRSDDNYNNDDTTTNTDIPSPARVRWIDAFNKVCNQLNQVGLHYLLYYSVSSLSMSAHRQGKPGNICWE